jgi:cytoskeletal protein RodZ
MEPDSKTPASTGQPDSISPPRAASNAEPQMLEPQILESEMPEPQAPKPAPGPRRKPVLGASLLALMALSAVGYFYLAWDASRETSAPNSEQSTPPPSAGAMSTTPRLAERVQSPSPSAQPATAPPQTTASTAEPKAPLAAATPSPPASLGPPPGSQSSAPQDQTATSGVQAENSARPAAPPSTSLKDQTASLPGNDIVFVQKPRVNIRAEPKLRSRVVGSATEGAQFKVLRRAGSWVQVDGDAGAGWIGDRLVGPRSP